MGLQGCEAVLSDSHARIAATGPSGLASRRVQSAGGFRRDDDDEEKNRGK